MAFSNQYVLGRGKVYFTRFNPGTKTPEDGERYIGNCPSINFSSSEDKLEHYSSEGGLKVLDAAVTLQLTRSGAFTTDNINLDNLALLVAGETSALTQTSGTALTQTIEGHKDRYYQVGQTAGNPSGVVNISNVVITDNATGLVTLAAGNYTVDLAKGRVYLKDDAADVVNGTLYKITYDVAAASRTLVVSKTDTVYGAIRFISDNGYGVNNDYYLPYVKIAPNGDFNLIGDEWQQIEFSMDVLKLDSTTESMYINGRPVAP
jgi:hypothetical protein